MRDHKIKLGKPRRQFDETYKRHAVELTLRGNHAVTAMARQPAAFVVLEALPLTPNGGLDRRALSKPEFTVSSFRAPRPPQKETDIRAWNDSFAFLSIAMDLTHRLGLGKILMNLDFKIKLSIE